MAISLNKRYELAVEVMRELDVRMEQALAAKNSAAKAYDRAYDRYAKVQDKVRKLRYQIHDRNKEGQ